VIATCSKRFDESLRGIANGIVYVRRTTECNQHEMDIVIQVEFGLQTEYQLPTSSPSPSPGLRTRQQSTVMLPANCRDSVNSEQKHQETNQAANFENLGTNLLLIS
jgi:hypothetical protein